MNKHKLTMNEFIEIVNKKLDEYLIIQYPEDLFKSMRYTVLLPGKRLRPVMCLETCQMLGGDFQDAILTERQKQRRNILANPTEYLERIKNTRQIIEQNGVNPTLTENALRGLDELQQDFIAELARGFDK